jgi:ABC-type Fe3+ transport system permease subunit
MLPVVIVLAVITLIMCVASFMLYKRIQKSNSVTKIGGHTELSEYDSQRPGSVGGNVAVAATSEEPLKKDNA